MGYLLSYWIMNVSVVSKRQNDSKWQKRRRCSRELSFICQLDGQEAILAPFRSRLTKKHVSVQNPGKPLCTEQPKDPASYAMSARRRGYGYYQACKLKFRLRDFTSSLCSAAAWAVCFEGSVAGVNATETGNEVSQPTLEFTSLVI